MSEWLDTPEGRACVEAGAEHIREHVHGADLEDCTLCDEAMQRALAAALDVRVACEECGGAGGEMVAFRGDSPYWEDCWCCYGLGTVPALYPRGEK